MKLTVTTGAKFGGIVVMQRHRGTPLRAGRDWAGLGSRGSGTDPSSRSGTENPATFVLTSATEGGRNTADVGAVYRASACCSTTVTIVPGQGKRMAGLKAARRSGSSSARL
ncbi:MAG: hypothetical protein U0231_04315 [Nitrospiraceae bacterium]